MTDLEKLKEVLEKSARQQGGPCTCGLKQYRVTDRPKVEKHGKHAVQVIGRVQCLTCLQGGKFRCMMTDDSREVPELRDIPPSPNPMGITGL